MNVVKKQLLNYKRCFDDWWRSLDTCYHLQQTNSFERSTSRCHASVNVKR